MKKIIIFLLLIGFLGTVVFFPRDLEKSKIKYMILNSNMYFNKKILLYGRFTRKIKNNVLFLFEDDSGEILVSTEDIKIFSALEINKNCKIFGKLKSNQSHLYFSIYEQPKCH